MDLLARAAVNLYIDPNSRRFPPKPYRCSNSVYPKVSPKSMQNDCQYTGSGDLAQQNHWKRMSKEPIGGPGWTRTIDLGLLDNALPQPLAEACAEEGRYEFMLTVNPLRVVGGTGSPVNPIALFLGAPIMPMQGFSERSSGLAWSNLR